jgi:hypothetical protein
VPRPTAEAEGCRARNIMKRKGIISVFILLVICTSACSSTGAKTAKPTRQPGELSLDMPSECKTLTKGLCIVSEPGEWLGEGKTTIIDQEPEAVYLEPSTAIQIKIEDWTLIFDPGEGKPFSVGMTFPDAKLYPQGKNVGMTIEYGDKKCDVVEGAFTDDILQSAQKGDFGVNPISAFDIRFTMRCNEQPQVIYGRVKLPL